MTTPAPTLDGATALIREHVEKNRDAITTFMREI